ncbi:MAG: hypothetical protein ABEJ95_03950 [Candidatus Nanohalobium sp.]
MSSPSVLPRVIVSLMGVGAAIFVVTSVAVGTTSAAVANADRKKFNDMISEFRTKCESSRTRTTSGNSGTSAAEFSVGFKNGEKLSVKQKDIGGFSKSVVSLSRRHESSLSADVKDCKLRTENGPLNVQSEVTLRVSCVGSQCGCENTDLENCHPVLEVSVK